MKRFVKKGNLRVALILILTAGMGMRLFAYSPAQKDSLEGDRIFRLAGDETDPDCKVALYREASLHFKAADLPVQWWKCLDNITWDLFQSEREAETFAWIDTAISEIWWPEDTKTATIYATRGYYLKQVKDYYPAKNDYENAFSLIRKNTTLTCQHGFTIMKTLANLYTQFGDYEKARILLESALDLCEDYDNPSKIAAIISDLGTVYRFEGETEKAIDLYSRGLSIKGTDTNTQGLLLLNKAEALHLINQNTEALPLAQQAISLLQKAEKPNARYLEGAEGILGAIYEKLGKRTDALKHFHDAIDLGKAAFGETPRREAGKIYQSLGEFALDEKNYEEAEKYFSDVVKTIVPDLNPEILGNPRYVADNVLMSGLEGLGATAWESYHKSRRPELLKTAFTRYSEAIRVQTVLREGFEYHSSRFKLQEESILRYESAIAAAFQLYDTTGDISWLDSAFALFENSRALVLKAMLAELEAQKNSHFPHELVAKRNELESACLLYERQIFEEKQFSENPDKAGIQFWEERLHALRLSLDSVVYQLKISHPGGYEMSSLRAPRNISGLQQWLADRNEQMVQYFWGESALFILSVDARGIRSQSIPFDKVNLAAKIDSLRMILSDYRQTEDESLGSAYFKAYSHLAFELYQLILAPVLSEKKSGNQPERLLIIPDGLIGYLPVDVLLTSSADASQGFRTMNYLFNDYMIRYGYSAGLSMAPVAYTEKPESILGGYAPSYGGTWLAEARRSLRMNDIRAFNDLKYNQPEVKSITQITGGESFLGTDATETVFRQTAAQFRILHLSMHGFTNEENPLYSGLVFSVGDNSSPNLGDVNLRGMGENTTDGATAISENTSTDGFLHVFEIFGMKLNAELAVLSACKTGLGKQFRGEGIMSLARAFRAAGCPNVVMSLWEANDQSTRQIMERFYFHLKAGKPKDEALYLAKHDYLSSAAADRINPVFWSTFVLIGDATPVFSPDYTIWFYFLGGILILGVMCLAIFLYRRKPGQHI